METFFSVLFLLVAIDIIYNIYLLFDFFHFKHGLKPGTYMNCPGMKTNIDSDYIGFTELNLLFQVGENLWYVEYGNETCAVVSTSSLYVGGWRRIIAR